MTQHPSSNNSLEFLAAREMESGKGRSADPKGPGKRGRRLEWTKGAGPGATPQHRVQLEDCGVGSPSPLPQAAGQHVSVTDSRQQTHAALRHAHFYTHTGCHDCSSDSPASCWVTSAARVCQDTE